MGRREGRKDGRSQMARDAAVRLCLLGRTEKGHTGNLNNRVHRGDLNKVETSTQANTEERASTGPDT